MYPGKHGWLDIGIAGAHELRDLRSSMKTSSPQGYSDMLVTASSDSIYPQKRGRLRQKHVSSSQNVWKVRACGILRRAAVSRFSRSARPSREAA